MNFGDYQEAADRTARWTLGLLREDGLEGCSSAILGYYKAPMGLFATGHAREASQVLGVMEGRFYRDGDFHALDADPTPGGGRSYRNAWIGWGAHELGAYQLSIPAFDRLESGLHPLHGGCVDNDGADASKRTYPAGGTAMVANALLSAGRVASAVRAGGFLRQLYDEQPLDTERVLLVRDADGVTIDPVQRGITSGVEALVFDLKKPDQICWIFGLSIRAFARLYRATGDQSWLLTAQRLRTWLSRSHPSMYSTVTNGKLAWGAAEMYGVTGDPEWFELADRIGGWMVGQQGADGVWVRRPAFSSSADQPIAVSLDTSIERMFYMIDIPRAVGLRRS